jgi:two-component system, sensor histidine kinase PdtaS
MRHFALIWMFLWLPLGLIAKESNVDSLRRAYDKAVGLEEKIALALTLGNHYFYFNQDSAEFFYAAGRQSLPTEGYDSLYIKIYDRSSALMEILGENKKALDLVHKANTRVKLSGRTNELDQMYILLGRYHMRDTQYDSATYYYNLLLQSKDAKGEEYLKWLPHHYLGTMYDAMDNWPLCKMHFEKALEYLRLENKPKDILYVLYMFIEIAEMRKDYDLYSRLRNEYLSIKQSTGQNILNPEHSMMRQITQSPAEQRKSLYKFLPYHMKNGSLFSTCDSYYRIGQTYLEENNYPEAIENLKIMMAYTDSINVPFLKYNGHLALQKAYLAQGDYKNAYTQYEYMYVLRDTLLDLEKQKQLSELNIKYETAEKEKQLAEASLHLETAKKKEQFLSFGLLGALIVSGLSYYAFRTKIKSNKLLEEKNQIISRALQEKDILLREIHHRVKNNLQMISALLYLHGKSVDDSSAQLALMESQNRVQSMAMIHQNLYQQDNLLGVGVQEYLDKLISHLTDSYNIEKHRITINKNIEIQHLDVDTVIPLALIINELISNALKYAFKDGRQGQIDIFLGQTDGQIMLEVKDNGVGMPVEVSTREAGNFGFKLINILCDRLGATWSAHSEAGTRITLSVPMKKAA